MAWIIDHAHSSVEFAVKYMMLTTVRGRFNTFRGTLEFNPEQPERSTVEGIIETASIDTGDAMREKHLASGDFFDVEKYPAMTFRSTRIEPAGKNRYTVTGDLTIKDVTREVRFDTTLDGQGKDPFGNIRIGFSAQTVLNRKDYGLNWNVALEAGGFLVADEVKIAIEAQFIQQKAAVAAEQEVEAEAKSR